MGILEKSIAKRIREYGQADNEWVASTNYLNRLGWELSWRLVEDQWCLFSSSEVIFNAESIEVMRSFVYGLADQFRLLERPKSK